MAKNVDGPNDSTPIIIDTRLLDSYHGGAEINFIDLWISLVKEKKIFFYVWLSFLFIGSIYFVVRPNIYEYSTTISIGTKEDGITPIQTAEAVRTEIAVYINQSLHKYFNDNSDNIASFIVKNPNNTNLMVITSQGTLDDESLHTRIHQDILAQLVSRHETITNAIFEGLEAEKLETTYEIDDWNDSDFIKTEKLKLEQELENQHILLTNLKNEESYFKNVLKRLEKSKKFLERDSQNIIDSLKKLQSKILESNDAGMVILRQDYLNRLSSLEHRLNIDIPKQEEETQDKIKENFLAQSMQQVAIQNAQSEFSNFDRDRLRELASLKVMVSNIEARMKDFPVTRAVGATSRTLEPINGKEKLLIFITFVLVGVLLSIFAALFSAMLSKVEASSNK